MITRPTVTVVIPTHNRVNLLAEAVASVLAELTVPLQVVVVDDASSDGTAAWRRRPRRPSARAPGARDRAGWVWCPQRRP